ncbi:helix-turn-helix domain-containing protein [Salinactinospora qingdaonensis]|uniref:Helix-turn-helix transcriptional regulator n=1 Tax=Salinactinospora qingdaonensis TaxID=702744 RepID=A0ABP7GCV8_9ACTN
MKRQQAPSIRSRKLAAELRRLRANAGYTTTQAAKECGWPQSRLSKMELAQQQVKQADLTKLLDIYDVKDQDTRRALSELVRGAGKRGWWMRYRDVLTDALPDFEAEASAIRAYESQVIPGLLQTPTYAEAVFRGSDVHDDMEMKRHVEARMQRQQILTKLYPPVFSAVIDEAAVVRLAEDTSVQIEQLRHLLHMAKKPDIGIYVLPFSAGMHAATLGSFMILDFPAPFYASIGYAETPTSTVWVEGDEDLRHYNAIWTSAQNAALTPAASVRFITEAMKTMESRS